MPRYIGKACVKHPELYGERRNGNCPACQRERAKPMRSRVSVRKKVRKWRTLNPERYAESAHTRSAVRRARKRDATPEDTVAIRHAFARLARRAKRLGMTVDHIVPIAGCRVCGAKGMHEPGNWQLLTNAANAAKGNRCDDCWR